MVAMFTNILLWTSSSAARTQSTNSTHCVFHVPNVTSYVSTSFGMSSDTMSGAFGSSLGREHRFLQMPAWHSFSVSAYLQLQCLFITETDLLLQGNHPTNCIAQKDRQADRTLSVYWHLPINVIVLRENANR